ncbi:MAG: prolipoprotein diacylglyceryl transferase [Myxococcales bacterium]|nr:prolipoprotein diacylglyceryl transferase [Myxococcales bacterium]
MHPILFRIPMPGWDLPIFGKVDSIPIYSYGVMLGLSLVVGWYLTLGLAKRDGLPRDTMANNYVITAVSAVLGSRVLYVITDPGKFQSFGDFFSFRTGGLVAYGGFLGGYLASWAYLRWKKLRLLPWADVAVPSLASGLLVTRIGCYLYGCDFGRPLGEGAPGWLKTAGTFPHWPAGFVPEGEGSPAWIQHVNDGLVDAGADSSLPVHPTQIYESLVGLGLLVILLLARRRQRFRGQIFLYFPFGYAVCRFLLELVRADKERGVVPIHGSGQWLVTGALALFALGLTRILAVIERVHLRRALSVLAFAPAVAAFFLYRPGAFVEAEVVSLSTSQFIALLTGLAAAAAFAVFHKAALAHPESAMALALPGGPASEAAVPEPGRPPRGSGRDARAEARTRARIEAARELPPPEEDAAPADAPADAGPPPGQPELAQEVDVEPPQVAPNEVDEGGAAPDDERPPPAPAPKRKRRHKRRG